ncbi:MAG: hypothetical protein U5O39_04770 [Gammaproteobacteria bacterium]|nr:hypothetical protein [Gammaproteobacteria bacterium]
MTCVFISHNRQLLALADKVLMPAEDGWVVKPVREGTRSYEASLSHGNAACITRRFLLDKTERLIKRYRARVVTLHLEADGAVRMRRDQGFAQLSTDLSSPPGFFDVEREQRSGP